MKQIIILSLLLFTTIAVSAQKFKKKKMKEQQQEIKMSLNETGNFVLHQTYEKPNPENPYPGVSFYVYDLKNHEIVYRDTISRGKVSWSRGTIIKIWEVPGMVRHDHQSSENYTYIDVCSGEKMSKTSKNKKRDL